MRPRSNGYSAPTATCSAFNARSARAVGRRAHTDAPDNEQFMSGVHRTSRRGHMSELQRSEPNGLVTWLAHRTVRCTIRQTASTNGHFGGWGYKYPNHPTIHCIQVFHFPTTTRALAFNSRHTKEIKSSPIPHKTLVTRESDLPCSFELLRLDCFFSFSLVLVIKTPL